MNRVNPFPATSMLDGAGEARQRGPQLVKTETTGPNQSILSSWKEIAAYLGKGVRTVQRWENELGLPVHRPVPGSRRIVITTKEELAAWLVQQHTRAQAKQKPEERLEVTRLKSLLLENHARAEQLRETTAALLQQLERTRENQNRRSSQRGNRQLERDSLPRTGANS